MLTSPLGEIDIVPTFGFVVEETVAVHCAVNAGGGGGGGGVGEGDVGGVGVTNPRLLGATVVPPQPAISTTAKVSACERSRGKRDCMTHTPWAATWDGQSRNAVVLRGSTQ